MRYYYDLGKFFKAVDERIENGKTIPPTLYRATERLDRIYEEDDDSMLWLLDKRYGKDKGGVEFESYEEAQAALLDHFNEEVANKIYDL